jgi:hypothetical protein
MTFTSVGRLTTLVLAPADQVPAYGSVALSFQKIIEAPNMLANLV